MAMVEAQSSKRLRDEEQDAQTLEDPKRQKSYNHILSLLDEEEEEPTQDLNSLITTLQQELSTDAQSNPDNISSQTTADASENYNSSSSGSSSSSSSLKESDEDESSVERVMRHLLEASDDELGIPHRETGSGFEDAEEELFSFRDNGVSFCDGLWELEDEAANYYTLVQSELFM